MNFGLRDSRDEFAPADEGELHLVIKLGIQNIGRRPVHPSDQIAAARVATEVVRAMQKANYIVLQAPRINSSD